MTRLSSLCLAGYNALVQQIGTLARRWLEQPGVLHPPHDQSREERATRHPDARAARAGALKQ